MTLETLERRVQPALPDTPTISPVLPPVVDAIRNEGCAGETVGVVPVGDRDLPRGEVASPRMLELTILMPCLDEALTLASCIRKARRFLERAGIDGEVLIADNGSGDGSQVVARRAGARVVDVSVRGYGSALRAGIAAARGRYVVMGDADDSYDFESLDGFVKQLRAGADLVVGNRFVGGIAGDAMPLLHRYLGNPVLSFLGRLLFRAPVGDFHCGLRAFRRDAILALGLCEPGMEFASEMVVKASLAKLAIAEVPTTLVKDGRDRAPHLKTWRDGWRHLRFLLMLSPRWALCYPGALMTALGWMLQLVLLPGSLTIGGIGFDVHTMLFSAAIAMVGNQLLMFGLLARGAGAEMGLLPRAGAVLRIQALFTLERAIAVAAVLMAASLGLALFATGQWKAASFAALDPVIMMRPAILSVALGVTGCQLVVGALCMSLVRYSARQRTGE